ncbi:hypothetical protein EX30DRAFT_339916 [Ascodesmis nigricans]|uniref:Mid2 domain-containing protein n=1 Tax=Ascodesmis nigricans TaxID=341454 RepID=A0A4S2N0L5_9PEZI|nr:hypothetical protein EX30DRAFT_339916 [Ascodesmis nigricans]
MPPPSPPLRLFPRQLAPTSYSRSTELCELYTPKAYWLVCAGGLIGCCLSPSCSQCTREQDKLMVPIEALMEKDPDYVAPSVSILSGSTPSATTTLEDGKVTVTVVSFSSSTSTVELEVEESVSGMGEKSKLKPSAAIPAGAALGGVALVLLLLGTFFLFRRRRRRRRRMNHHQHHHLLTPNTPNTPMPPFSAEPKSPLSFLKRFSRRGTEKQEEYFTPQSDVVEMSVESGREVVGELEAKERFELEGSCPAEEVTAAEAREGRTEEGMESNERRERDGR